MSISLYSPFDVTRLPPGDDDDYINMGSAVITFYSMLLDLLGRCAIDPMSEGQSGEASPDGAGEGGRAVDAEMTAHAAGAQAQGGAGAAGERASGSRADSIRIRAILRSLVPLDDLLGILAIPFILPSARHSEPTESHAPASALTFLTTSINKLTI